MQDGKVLIGACGGIKPRQSLDLGDDRFGKDVCRVQLRDISLGDAFLLVVGIENLGAVLRAHVGTLIVEFGRVVRDREIYLQNFAERNLPRIERHLHRFGIFHRFGISGVPVPTISECAVAFCPPA